MIRVFINNNEIQNFESKQVYRDIEALSGSASFYSNSSSIVPFSIGDSIRVEVNGVTKLDGFIDEFETQADISTGTTVQIEARDKVQDLLDSTLKDVRQFEPPISLEQIIRATLDDLGLTDVGITNNAPNLELFQLNDLISGEMTQNAFEFIDLHAKKRQVLLTGDGAGNIVIQRATQQNTIPGILVLRDEVGLGTNINNIKRSRRKENHTERYGIYVARSQGNLSALAEVNIPPADGVNVSGDSFTDSEIRNTRNLVINPEQSSDAATNTNRAEWEANIRKTRSFVYTCQVQGHQLNGQNYDINRLVQVQDEVLGVNELLLIKCEEYIEDLTEGTVTNLTLVKRGSYTLEG